MNSKDMSGLVDHIDSLLSTYLSERKRTTRPGKMVRAEDMDIDRILDEGLYPPDDSTTPTRLAILSIGETLGRIGGEALMQQVHDAYEAKYGASKANSLSARWDSAAGIWFY